MPAHSEIVMSRPERTSDRAPGDHTDRWRGRPVTAAALKAGLYLGPLLAALLVTRLVHAVWPSQDTGLGQALLWTVLLAVGFGVAVGAERWTRRFLPVAMLMRLTLVFPDQAPSRYKVMRAAASPSALQQIVASGTEASEAAAQVLGLVTQLARHDKHTRGHSERVRVFADLIAEQMGVVGLDRDKLRWSALLHDVGKLDVPAATLNKPGRPDDVEWSQLQGHPAAGAERCGALYAWLGEWAGGITEHHERWDGNGYPAGLAGVGISLAGRIVAVADAYETMTAARAYKKPMATAAARQELADCAGGQFDPRVVRAFLEISLPKLLWRVGPLSFFTHLPFMGSLQVAGQSVAATAAAAAAPAAVAGLSAAVVVGVLPAVAASPVPRPVHESHAPGASLDHDPRDSSGGGEQGGARATPAGSMPTGPADAPAQGMLGQLPDPADASAVVVEESAQQAVDGRPAEVPAGGARSDGAGGTSGRSGRSGRDDDEAEADRAAHDDDKADEGKAARDEAARDRADKDRADKDRADKDRADRDKAARAKAARNKAARDRADKDKAGKDAAARDRADEARADKDRADEDRADEARADRARDRDDDD